mmetsp:Transcript_20115/g.27724  ORF Transcript_20115/g.27724 Transcript_20115/m.27724 type:complete len:548 (-) Transcript_20115:326-1969(-)
MNFYSLIIFILSQYLSDALMNFKAPTSNINDWPEDGPWIVSVAFGKNEHVIADAKKSHKNRQLAVSSVGVKKLNLKHSFTDEKGYNAIVIDGVLKHELLSIDGVLDVYPDIILSISQTQASSAWGIIQLEPIKPAPKVYTPLYYGCGVDVYIVDTGLDTNHIEFQSLPGYSRTVANLFSSYGAVSSNTDGHGHGTFCAATVGGKSVGVSPCSNVYGMKVLSDQGTGSMSDVINALSLIKARHLSRPGSRSVITMSFSGNCYSVGCSGDPLITKLQELLSVGIIFTAAAGNSNNGLFNACQVTPAAAEGSVSVAASDKLNNLAWFSNIGSCVNIVAPGVAVKSACAKSKICNSERNYTELSGTSMAAPHVAGVLAQLWEKNPTASAAQVKMALYCDAVHQINITREVPSYGATPDLLAQVPIKNSFFAGCEVPTAMPTTLSPSKRPTRTPTSSRPSTKPTRMPTSNRPSTKPTRTSTINAAKSLYPPTRLPTKEPTNEPTYEPTFMPTTLKPTRKPTDRMPTSIMPTRKPTSRMPSKRPTRYPTTGIH